MTFTLQKMADLPYCPPPGWRVDLNTMQATCASVLRQPPAPRDWTGVLVLIACILMVAVIVVLSQPRHLVISVASPGEE